jgi:hypothetical protein
MSSDSARLGGARLHGERARVAFSAWLDDHPRPTAAEFAVLRAVHGDLAADLDRLWRALARYESVIGSRDDGAAQRVVN